MTLSRVAASFLSLCLFGCNDFSSPRPGPPVPVIQALLILHDSTQVLTAFWSIPSDSSVSASPRPVDTAAVRLFLMRPAGDSVAFIATGSPGTYRAATAVVAGSEYRLVGSVAGRPIAATAVVPDTLVMTAPGGDTIALGSGSFGYVFVPYRWSATGALTYEYTAGPAVGVVSDTIGELRLIRSPNPAISTLTVLSLDVSATRYLEGKVPVSNIEGAMGFLGAASVTHRTIRWQ